MADVADELTSFERALLKAINASHDCDCSVCQAGQDGTSWLAVIAWLRLPVTAQTAWLDRHEDDELRDILASLLDLAHEWRDLGQIAVELEERRLDGERRRAALEKP